MTAAELYLANNKKAQHMIQIIQDLMDGYSLKETSNRNNCTIRNVSFIKSAYLSKGE